MRIFKFKTKNSIESSTKNKPRITETTKMKKNRAKTKINCERDNSNVRHCNYAIKSSFLTKRNIVLNAFLIFVSLFPNK